MYQRGIVHLLPLLVIAIILVGAYVLLKDKLKLPEISLFKKAPKVELKTEYQNPFKKDTQYVNPFETYKNPFTVNR